MNAEQTRAFVEAKWRESIVPALERYIAIPNLSPAFDKGWREAGHMEAAVELIASWIEAQQVSGLRLEVVRLEKRTPLIFAEIPGETSETVLLYGHLDKQPPMEPWSEGLGPWHPVHRDGRLYGRGAADDGYSAFASIAAIEALQRQGLKRARCVVLIEACEESGSYDLPAYIEALAERIGRPSLVICLDSGCGNYEQLWMTTSLRGLIGGRLTVSTLSEGVHSGGASGIVPSSFRVLRLLLSRLEEENTGEIRPRQLHAEIPKDRLAQVREAARVLGDAVYQSFPFHGTTGPVSLDPAELLLNRTWRPQLEVIGAAGFPPLESAGNVLRPFSSVRLSLRLPPTVDARAAGPFLEALFHREPPYGATVEFKCGSGASGWNAPALAPWLEAAARQASLGFFGKEPCYMGEGGSIPFMGLLGEKFPDAQFMITGVLGPQSNAHGPNEFLHLPAAERLTACVASVLAAHARR